MICYRKTGPDHRKIVKRRKTVTYGQMPKLNWKSTVLYGAIIKPPQNHKLTWRGEYDMRRSHFKKHQQSC